MALTMQGGSAEQHSDESSPSGSSEKIDASYMVLKEDSNDVSIETIIMFMVKRVWLVVGKYFLKEPIGGLAVHEKMSL